MKIKQIFYNNENFEIKNSMLGNCYIVTENHQNYYYEFITNQNTATIIYSNPEYLELIIDEFRKNNEYINEFKTIDNTLKANFNPVQTFKLPIDSLQITNPFLDKNRIDFLIENIDENNTFLPVIIHNDEYVFIGDHHLLYALKENRINLINVFINTKITNGDLKLLSDFIYILKENNIKNIKDCEIIDENYELIYNQYKNTINNLT